MKHIILDVEIAEDTKSFYGEVADVLDVLARHYEVERKTMAQAYVEGLEERARMTERLYQRASAGDI